jgi:peptidoglycan/xylan/chitin deacetylase (PgdA/CDA1 family)
MASSSERPSTTFRWPNEARAAVSLTYDDGRRNHLDAAIPDLEQAQFRGTFYLTHDNPDVEMSVDRWRAAFRRGHEIGNHSYNHPSSEELSGYDPEDILAEVGFGALWLKRIVGPDPDRSYAYPGGEQAIGAGNLDRDSYTRAISRYHKVARAAGGWPNDPRDVQLPISIIRAAMIDTPRGCRLVDLKTYCEVARRNSGHWAVIMFHDVVEDDHPVGSQISRDIHRQFLTYLRDEQFWVAPVKEVAGYVFRHGK